MEDRIVGTIVGVAVGDALGAPLEFMSREQIEIKHGAVTEMIGGGWLGLRSGAWTGDTAMMLQLLQSILEKGQFDLEDVADRYLRWYKTKPVDIGNTVRAALALIEGGTPVVDASRLAHEGAGGRSAGNGTVARCAPLAVRYFDDAKRLMETSFLDARITHWDIRAASGSAFLNLVLSALLRGADRQEAFAWADEQILENDHGLYTIVPDVSFLSERDLKPAGDVIDTLTCAFWCFRQGRHFEDTLIKTISLGGDTDTIGAVAGALAGARWGYGQIPSRWSQVLQDRGLILNLATRLAKEAGRGFSPPTTQ